MGWEGGVYSQEDGTQVLQQGDLVWVWGYHKVQNVSATGTYRGAAAGWDTLLVSSLYTNTSRVSTVNAVYTIACLRNTSSTSVATLELSLQQLRESVTDRQTDTQHTSTAWLVPCSREVNWEETSQYNSNKIKLCREQLSGTLILPLLLPSCTKQLIIQQRTLERETWDQRVNRCDDIYLHMVALI